MRRRLYLAQRKNGDTIQSVTTDVHQSPDGITARRIVLESILKVNTETKNIGCHPERSIVILSEAEPSNP